jgi:hypothetical protein
MPTIDATAIGLTPIASLNCGIITAGADRSAYW